VTLPCPTPSCSNCFDLIAILKAGRWTIKQLVDRFDSSKSSMYAIYSRWKKGFFVEKDFHDRYFIVTTDDDPLQTQLTIDEMHVLHTLMQGAAHQPRIDLFLHFYKTHTPHWFTVVVHSLHHHAVVANKI